MLRQVVPSQPVAKRDYCVGGWDGDLSCEALRLNCFICRIRDRWHSGRNGDEFRCDAACAALKARRIYICIEILHSCASRDVRNASYVTRQIYEGGRCEI